MLGATMAPRACRKNPMPDSRIQIRLSAFFSIQAKANITGSSISDWIRSIVPIWALSPPSGRTIWKA